MFGRLSLKFFLRINSVLLVCSLSACSIFYTPGMSQLRELCEKDGGMPVYQEVKAKGYFNKWIDSCGCGNFIVGSNFDFMEFEISKARVSDELPENGLWRISKISRESGMCNSEYEKWLDRKRGSSGYDEFSDKHCIKAEKITSPISRYFYRVERENRKVSEYYGSTITRIEAFVTDSENEEVVVRKVDYLLNPFPESSLSYGKVYSCFHVLGEPGFKKEIMPDT